MAHIRDFVKREPTLCAAFLAALISCFFVRPDAQYAEYLDLRTLALLYALMVVVAGLRSAGVFAVAAHTLCRRAGQLRLLGFILTALCFFSSMLVTNDVARLTFVPLAVAVLGGTDCDRGMIFIVVLQTVAANLGSMLTPVGNPQNIYLHSHYAMSSADFFGATVPVWALSLVLIAALCFLLPRRELAVELGEKPILRPRKLVLYALLFILCMLTVLRVLAWWWMLLGLAAVLLFADRKMLLKADFLLLLTFVCFFVFSGNLARIGAVDALLRRALEGRELLLGAAVSQVISNVPAALLLSGFTDNARELLLGVNIGGLGTPVASLASLISLKLYGHAERASTGRFLAAFSAVNFGLLALLLLFAEFAL